LNGYSDLAHFSRTVDPTECTAPLGAACNASNRPLDAAPNDPALAVAIGELRRTRRAASVSASSLPRSMPDTRWPAIWYQP
jgi:hypothetical protein